MPSHGSRTPLSGVDARLWCGRPISDRLPTRRPGLGALGLIGALLAAVLALAGWPLAPTPAIAAAACVPEGPFLVHRHDAIAAGEPADAPEVRSIRAAEFDVPPAITTPTWRQRMTDRSPTISGECAPPAVDGVVRVGGQTLVVRADADGNWAITPAALDVGDQIVSATWVIDGNTVEAEPVRFTVIPTSPVIQTPADGATTLQARPTITGSAAEPRASVTVVVDDQVLTVIADDQGRWTATPGRDLAVGTHRITAIQAFNGAESDPATAGFMVGSPTPSGAPASTTASPTAPTSVTVPPVPPVPPVPKPAPKPVPKPVPNRTTAAPAPPRSGDRPTVPGPHRRSAARPEWSDRSVRDPARPGARDTPDPAESPAPGVEGVTSPAVQPPAGSTPPDYVGVRFSVAPGRIVPGQVASFVGVVGPNPDSVADVVTVSGTLNRGVLYRSVDSDPAGSCAVTTLRFSCAITLLPGQQATLRLRLLADAAAPPSYARQQVSVTSAVGPARPSADGSSTVVAPAGAVVRNTMTRTTPIRSAEGSLSKAAIADGPAGFLVVLVLYLFTLAAAEYERRHPR